MQAITFQWSAIEDVRGGKIALVTMRNPDDSLSATVLLDAAGCQAVANMLTLAAQELARVIVLPGEVTPVRKQ